MPATNMRRVQLGQQTSFGTAVAATAWLRGVTDVNFSVMHETEPLPELSLVVGSSIVPGYPKMAEGAITLGATYQHIRYGLQGLLGAPSTTGSSPPYTHSWVLPAGTTLPSPTIYTVEYGVLNDTTTNYRAIGSVVREHTLRGEAGGYVEQEMAVIARALESNAMTTGLALANVEPMSMIHSALWIDPTTNNFGTTAINNALISFEWTVNTNRHLKLFGGAVNPQSWGDGRWESTLSLNLEWTSQTKSLVDALLTGNVVRRIRVRVQESASRSLTIDFAGVLTNEAELYGDRDGNMTCELEFTASYDINTGGWLSVTLINDVQNLQ